MLLYLIRHSMNSLDKSDLIELLLIIESISKYINKDLSKSDNEKF